MCSKWNTKYLVKCPLKTQLRVTIIDITITTDVIKSRFEKQFIKYETFKNTSVHTYFSNKTFILAYSE